MEDISQKGWETQRIFPSRNGISYLITGKDGKREGFIKYEFVESIYIESIKRQSKFPFIWLAMLIVLIFVSMVSLDNFLMKTIALCVFTLMGSFLLFDHYSQINQSCIVILLTKVYPVLYLLVLLSYDVLGEAKMTHLLCQKSLLVLFFSMQFYIFYARCYLVYC